MLKGFNKFYYDDVMNAIQNLEEISGPATLEDYIEILTAVKAAIDTRIQVAQSQILLTGETK